MIKLKNHIVIFVLGLVFILAACEKTPFDRPKNLIKEKQMINMLADMHLAESTYNHFRYDTTFHLKSSSIFYYSVLNKYQVPDSVFEKSFLYYASAPKNFERMYRKVLDKLSLIEQEYSGNNEDPLEFVPPKNVK